MNDNLQHVLDRLLRGIRVIAVVLLGCSVSVNFANIIGRYFLSASITWAEEIMLFLMIGCVFFGAATPAWEGRHIRMDVFVRMMPLPVQRALGFIADLALAMTSVLLVVFAWPTVWQLAEFDQRSMAANIPLVIPQSAIPIGLIILALVALARLVLRRWRQQPHVHDL